MAVIPNEIPMVDPDHVFMTLMSCNYMAFTDEALIQEHVDCIRQNQWQNEFGLEQMLIDLLGADRAEQVLQQL